MRNLTMTPNFPWVGEVARDVYAQTTGRTVDGVIALDPYVISALLEYSGPIELTTYPQQLNVGNAAQFLLRDQYVLGAADNDQRIDALSEAAELTMSAVLGGSMPDPTTIAGDLAPLVAERRLMVWSADQAVEQLVEQIHLDGAIPDLDGREGWAVTFSNAGGSKIDSFLSPSTEYRSSVDPKTGRTSARLTVRLHNTAPASGLPRYVIGNDVGMPTGTSRLYVSAYSSLTLTTAEADGIPASVVPGVEAGWNVYSGFVDIPPGDVVELTFELEGEVAQPGEVVTWQQPLAFEVDPAGG
jgi:fructose-specific component phosphotransferase system IIB-like protein